MKQLKKIKYTIAICLLTILLAACEGFVEIDPAPNLVETGKIFSSEETTESTFLGIYQFMRASNLSLTNGGMSLYHGLSADELELLVSNATYEPFFNNAVPTNSGTVGLFWGAGYRMLYRTNAIIEGVEKSVDLSPAYKAVALGEAHFLRAFYHFLLVNNFGDIPLALSSVYTDNMTRARDNVDVVYKTIIDDLLYAVDNLHDTHPSMGIYRANRYAAMALLARVYLYVGNWERASFYAHELISSPRFTLIDNVADVFLPASKENIWAISSIYSNNAEATVFVPRNASITPTTRISDKLVGAVDGSDPRWMSWTGIWTSKEGVAYYYPAKYKNNAMTPVTEQLIVLRLAEQYLIKAEALWKLNKGGEAIEVLNELRIKRGAEALDPVNDDKLIFDAIMKERQIELFCEWGHRWFDLKRLSLLDQELVESKPNWKNYTKVLPIPEAELLVNVNLTPNEGYE